MQLSFQDHKLLNLQSYCRNVMDLSGLQVVDTCQGSRTAPPIGSIPDQHASNSLPSPDEVIEYFGGRAMGEVGLWGKGK
jgi:hypothetical protein